MRLRLAGVWAAEKLPHPGRIIAGGFAGAVAIGTGLLSLPVSTTGAGRASFVDALFTATSAVCVTGLVTVDTGSYWSGFGEAVILLLIQAGGLGIMTVASLIAVLFSQRLRMRVQLVAQTETKSLTAADLRQLIRRIVVFSLSCEVVAAAVLTVRFATAYDQSVLASTYQGVFHGVSAFNNAGFGLFADSLMGYAGDPWVSLVVCLAVIIGGLGFPVVFELRREWRHPAGWSVLTRITVNVTGILLVLGTLVILSSESANPETLGKHDAGGKLLRAFFASVNARTAGFNSIDTSAMRPESLLATDALMFIGGGSAGTAGGIKVTTFGLLAYVLWSEMRGQSDVEVAHRRVPGTNQRQALAVALLAIALVAAGTFAMLSITNFSLDRVLFEVISAFATVGLSTGITANLPDAGHLLLIALMFVGRIGPLTLASALALRERAWLRQLPEERTIVG